jgi:formiminotetrahydrofolate cyclodeaminase
MNASIWPATLASFCDEVAGTNPAPAAVAVSAVTANLGLGLLIKVLEITGRRKSFSGDSQKLRVLIDAARRESEQLRNLADEDIAAVRQYVGSSNPSDARNAIEVPLRAARAAVIGLDLCAEASDVIRALSQGGVTQGLLAADLGAASLLLSAAVRAILLSADSNLRQLPSEDPYRAAVMIELSDLEIRLSDLGVLAGPS